MHLSNQYSFCASSYRNGQVSHIKKKKGEGIWLPRRNVSKIMYLRRCQTRINSEWHNTNYSTSQTWSWNIRLSFSISSAICAK